MQDLSYHVTMIKTSVVVELQYNERNLSFCKKCETKIIFFRQGTYILSVYSGWFDISDGSTIYTYIPFRWQKLFSFVSGLLNMTI